MKVWLTVFHENERALAFYRKHGWIELGYTFFCLYEERHKNIILGIDLEQ
jgi:ribosomal protein S18 acetylase RimI-like enzyme